MMLVGLEAFIQGFFGYGNPAGKLWFIGMEEGGGDSLPEVQQRLKVWHDLGTPAIADLAEFHRRLGMPEFFQDPVKRQHTWTSLIRVVLAAIGQPVELPAVKNYQRDCLGRANGETCLVELLPLPSPNTGTWHYPQWSKLAYLQSRELYGKAVLPGRIESLRKLMAKYRPPAVVCYGVRYQEWYEEALSKPLRKDDAAGFGWTETDYGIGILIRHPAAFGVKNENFEKAGIFIGEHLGAQP